MTSDLDRVQLAYLESFKSEYEVIRGELITAASKGLRTHSTCSTIPDPVIRLLENNGFKVEASAALPAAMIISGWA